MRDKYPFKNEADIGRLLEQIQAVNPFMMLSRNEAGMSAAKT